MRVILAVRIPLKMHWEHLRVATTSIVRFCSLLGDKAREVYLLLMAHGGYIHLHVKGKASSKTILDVSHELCSQISDYGKGC